MNDEREEWWIIHDEQWCGKITDAKMTPVMDLKIYADHSVRHDYGKHGLVRVCRSAPSHTTIKHYWRRVRVPWIVWAMFS